MVLGVAFAFFYMPEMMSWRVVATLSLALLATCLIASSNYVLNEVLDAPRDAAHPAKRFRPVPAGRIRPALAYAEWIVLGAVGVAIAFLVNRYFALMGMTLWAMGVVYNVPPIRSITPVAAGLFGFYLKIALQPNSPAQRPEKLYRERRFILYAVLSAMLFFALLFVRIPALYDLFNIESSSADRVEPLWTIGSTGR
jgi:4-hydroxybenzoate polyprenyltransferase